jgi:tetratricopeptide (TPR) repeat protein
VSNARGDAALRDMRFFLVIVLFAAVMLQAAEPKKRSDLKGQKKVLATNDPVQLEYLKVLRMDEAAEKEIEQWLKDAGGFATAGAAMSEATLRLRIQQRVKPVKEAYEEFIKKHPKHAEIRLAYGSFLMDLGEEEEAVVHMEKGREFDPTNPAAWNNLANHYGHRGPVKKAFEYYARAIELAPKEPTYPWNLATTTYLFRKDAQEFYNIKEQQVFDRALDLYRQAQKLDPTNLVLAVDLAQSYYGIKPMRTNEALVSWSNALSLAKNTIEQQGIFLHLARVELNTAHWEEARQHLTMVTNADMMDLKKRLERNWIEKRDKALGVTNSAVVYTNALTAKLN